MQNVASKLEFDKICAKLKGFTHTEIASFQAESLTMLSKEDLKDTLEDLKEAMSYADSHSLPPIHYHKNLMPFLSVLKKEGTGDISFFVGIRDLLENVKEILDFFEENESYPCLNRYLLRLNPLESLKNRIDSVITKNLDIYDHASTALYRIRNAIKQEMNGQSKLHQSLLDRYKKYLNSERLVLREQGLALPISISYKNQIDGVTIGISASGNTAFILPVEIMKSNQKIQSLQEEEKEEILRILRDLAKVVSKEVDVLKEDVFIVSSLDFLFAKVALAQEMKATIAEISENNSFSLQNARHPLIAKEKVVANSFVFDKEKIVLITGPNAGGKTVCLKTVGLLIYMHQAGLAIPCDEAILPYFTNLFVDIGDEQSLKDQLSTFTAHIHMLKEALEDIHETSFVIIDELGSGTSPEDGEALGVGVIEFLHQKNAFALLSSHYDGLKSFALENDYILNASMIFDEEILTPKYKIRFGVAGKSYGLEVASKEGLNPFILESAKKYLKSRESENENRLKILNEKLLEVDKLRATLEEQNQKLNEEISHMEKELAKVREEKKRLEKNAEEEKEKLVLETKKEIEEIMESFKAKKEPKLHEAIALKREIENRFESKEEEEEYLSQESFAIGDRVREKDSQAIGVIEKISKDTARVLLDSGLSMNVKMSFLRKVSQTKVQKKTKSEFYGFSSLEKQVPLECNLIGLHVQEAIDVLAKYFDDALTMHYHVVRVIHGFGTGKLRHAVWEYLKKQSFVESFRFGGMNEGGMGATVVNLK